MPVQITNTFIMSQVTERNTAMRLSSSTFATRYLFLYNVTMTAGWAVVLIRLMRAFLLSESVYAWVDMPLKIFQTGAILEIIHSLVGLIRAPASTTALQVASRLMLVWGVLYPVKLVRDELSVTTMVLAWSLTEIPRYFYFSVAAVAAKVPYWLVVTRYSTFYPLYPLGAGSEAYTMYKALPYLKDTGIFSVAMPNKWNFAFDYYLCCVCILFLYAPGLPFMYSHMLRQRRKYVVDRYSKPSKTE